MSVTEMRFYASAPGFSFVFAGEFPVAAHAVVKDGQLYRREFIAATQETRWVRLGTVMSVTSTGAGFTVDYLAAS